VTEVLSEEQELLAIFFDDQNIVNPLLKSLVLFLLKSVKVEYEKMAIKAADIN